MQKRIMLKNKASLEPKQYIYLYPEEIEELQKMKLANGEDVIPKLESGEDVFLEAPIKPYQRDYILAFIDPDGKLAFEKSYDTFIRMADHTLRCMEKRIARSKKAHWIDTNGDLYTQRIYMNSLEYNLICLEDNTLEKRDPQFPRYRIFLTQPQLHKLMENTLFGDQLRDEPSYILIYNEHMYRNR